MAWAKVTEMSMKVLERKLYHFGNLGMCVGRWFVDSFFFVVVFACDVMPGPFATKKLGRLRHLSFINIYLMVPS